MKGGIFMQKGKKLSILGDSVSTYYGYSNNKEANASTAYNPCFYTKRLFPWEETYWGILLKELSLTLCVNNSWSGGNLSGRDNPSSGVSRASELSTDSGEKPDIIIVFMGLNDLGRNVDDEVFYADYLYTLLTIKEKYPHAEVFCVNMPDRDAGFRIRTLLFNRRIEEAVHIAGESFFLVDLYNSKLNNDVFYMNTLDGLHPDQDGMRMIAEVIKEAMIENAKFKMSHRD